jgi:hypothetical protein
MISPIPPSAMPVVEILRRDVKRPEVNLIAEICSAVLELHGCSGDVVIEYSILAIRGFSLKSAAEFCKWFNADAADAMDAIWPK